MNLVPRRSLFDVDDLFDFWAPMRARESAAGTFAPRVDIKEVDDHYEITAELPGVDRDDVDVSLHNGILTINAETRDEDVEKKDGRIIRQERRYGRYSRSFDVGTGINEGDIAATFKDGVLTLRAPKSAPHKAEAKRIKVA